MRTALLYPLELIVFWYHDICIGTIDYFIRFNSYMMRVFSTELLLKTFFKPVKNEYRKGLVLFSIVFGIIVKSFLISLSLFFLITLLVVELLIIAILFLFPLILIYLIYAGENIFQFI